MMTDYYALFEAFTRRNGFKWVERSNLVSKYFKNEFNLSGGHSYLVPAVLNHNKVEREVISVIDLCIRKVDAQIVGHSLEHLLLFEMGVWGAFGYIEDKKEEEFKQMSLLMEFLAECGISRQDLYVTVCGGGQYLDRYMESDTDSVEIFRSLGFEDCQIIHTSGRRNFMLSRGIDRLAGYNVEFFVKRNDRFIEIASSNIYQFINKLTYLEETTNMGIGCGVGMERIECIAEHLDSTYDLPFYKSIIGGIKTIMNLSDNSELIIRDKLIRIIELSKTLIFLLNDKQYCDHTAQGKIMNSYFAKVTSEIDYLSLPYESFSLILRKEIEKKYERYSISEDAFSIFQDRISHLLNKRNNGTFAL